MKKYFIFSLSIFMLVLSACSNENNESNESAWPDDYINITDLVATVQYDNWLNSWSIYFFHPGSIDAIDRFIPANLDEKYQKRNLQVILSGKAFKLNIHRENSIAGEHFYQIQIDKIQEYNSEISKNNTSLSGCKSMSKTRAVSAFEYQAEDGGYLYFRHVNAMFNCEPDELYMIAEVIGNEIYVVEVEKNPKANCVCPYDLFCKIGPLTEGQNYRLHLNRGYDNVLFEFTYSNSMSGTWTSEN